MKEFKQLRRKKTQRRMLCQGNEFSCNKNEPGQQKVTHQADQGACALGSKWQEPD